MQERRSRGDAPFERAVAKGTPTLYIIVFWLVVGLLIWIGSNWVLERYSRPERHSTPASAPPSPPEAAAPTLAAPLRTVQGGVIATPEGRRSEPAPNSQQVVKCTEGGKTTYSNSPCPANAIASAVQIRQSPSPRPQEPTLTAAPVNPQTAEAQPPVVIAQASKLLVDGMAMRLAECKAMDVEIGQLDSWARQPQSGQTQDWIRQKRGKVRDRQFEIRCN